MKKISMFAAAAALALSAAAPVSAGESVKSDPFVSTQASAGLLAGGAGIGVGVAVLTVLVVVAAGDT